MAIELDHTIVPAHDKVESAKFFARIFGLSYDGEVSHFSPVRVNDSLTLDFENSSKFQWHHYAFKVSEEDFDHIFGRIQEAGIPMIMAQPRAYLTGFCLSQTILGPDRKSVV